VPATCFAMVRGSVVRITRLDAQGRVLMGPRSSLVTDGIAKMQIIQKESESQGFRQATRSQHSEPGGLFVQNLQNMRIRARGGIATGFRDHPRMPRRFTANRAEYRNRSLAARRVV
jgi:hypothetical protein